MKYIETNTKPRQIEKLPDIIKDKFYRARGSSSELFSLSCTRCGTEVLHYQKDGKGNLLRCYVDRMYLPNDFLHPINPVQYKTKSEMSNLQCPSCQTVIGYPMVFAPENRLAYRIIKGTLAKKKLK